MEITIVYANILIVNIVLLHFLQVLKNKGPAKVRCHAV